MGCGATKINSSSGSLETEEERLTTEALKLIGFTINNTVNLVKVFDKCQPIEGRVSFNKLLEGLGLPSTVGYKYFYRRSQNSDKETLTFRHFILNTWLMNTRSQEELASMYFDAYDEHQSGELSSRNIFRLIYDLYGNDEPDFKASELLREVERDTDETLSKHEYMNHVYKYRSILKPLYAAQNRVQNKVLGTAFWTQQMRVAPSILADNNVSHLFKTLPNKDYRRRDRVSRLPCLAAVNSYQKFKKSADESDIGPIVRRRKSSLIESVTGGGEIVRGGGGSIVRGGSDISRGMVRRQSTNRAFIEA